MRRRIRLAHLITHFPVGGAQDYLLSIVKHLNTEEFEAFVVGRMEGEWAGKAKSMPGVRWFDIPALRREISPWHDLGAVLQIKKFCVDMNIDILHTHSSKAGVVGRIAGALAHVPVLIHTVHGFPFNDFMPAWRKQFYVRIEKLMSRYSTYLLFVSRRDKLLADSLNIRGTCGSEVIYNGIDFRPYDEPFDGSQTRQSFGFSGENIIIGFTGRFTEQKGLNILIEAFADVHKQFPSTRLLLVGDGPRKSQLMEEIRKFHLSDAVVLAGFREDVPDLVRIMDLFCMTSLWEGLSRSLSEAMYARVPVVATDVGGTSDAIEPGRTGWLISPKDPAAASQAMKEIIGNSRRAKELALSAHEWAKSAFDMRAMIRRMEDLYRASLNETQRRGGASS